MERPADLKTDYQRDPSGIATLVPRFSWIPPRGARGSGQRAWRIICSANRGSIERGCGELWDSGVCESGDCHLVSYGGRPLAEGGRYWWAVKTWQEGGESPWSVAARFDIGLLQSSSWEASWISMPDAPSESTTVLLVEGSIASNRHVPARLYQGMYFRKEFSLPDRPSRALAFFCGLGYGELSLNGCKVGDHRLDPGQTDYREGALYATYDITEALRPGANAFGIMVGNGRYLDAYGFGKPRAILQVLLEYPDGSRTTLCSDDSWACSGGAVLHNGIYSGEVYDARLEEPGWDCPGFAGSSWREVELLEGHGLRPQTMPPIRATAMLPARCMSCPAPGIFVFDFGQNFAGVVRIKARGARGTAIALRFSELLGPDGMLHLGTNRESQSRDLWILRGEGEETFEPRFTYHGFRYVEVTGYPGTPSVDAVLGIVLHTDVGQTGSFSSSDPVANAIHACTLWGQRSNLMSAPTDCPQRGERMGWLGDAQLASEEACANFDMAGFYTKYLEDIRLAQKPDGSLSDVVPPYWPLYPADPAWATAYPVLAWAMYWHYGDVAILERHYEGIRRYVDFLDAASEGHILSLGSYGDWCPPGGIFPKKTPIEFVSTWYLCHDTALFARIAGVLGRSEDERAYSERAREIGAAFNARFLGKDGLYATLRTSPVERAPGQTSQALPLHLGLVPEALRSRAAEHLLTAVVTGADCHIDAGIVGARYIPEVLCDIGHADIAWRLVTATSYPGWGYMIAEGATTLWERWEKLAGMGMNSHNHIMFGSVDAWFYRSICGIVPEAPAWSRVRIAPRTPGKLAHASASRATPRGRLSVAWSRSPWLEGDGRVVSAEESSGQTGRGRALPRGGEFRLSVSIPDGTLARIELPYAAVGHELREGMTIIWSAEPGTDGLHGSPEATATALPAGIDSVRVDGAVLRIGAGSGDYEFVLSW